MESNTTINAIMIETAKAIFLGVNLFKILEYT
jgi:hypothetical protein